jgi:hypothetical protein
MTTKNQDPRSSPGNDLDQPVTLYTVGPRKGTPSGLVEQLHCSAGDLTLVELTLIDLEAGNIQRFG